MSIFLLSDERDFINRESSHGLAAWLYQSTTARVNRRAESPGLIHRDDTVEWWHLAEEAICDAAMIYALSPSPKIGAWLSNVVMGIVHRPCRDWVGPWFRDHSRNPPAASLETAHLTRAVAAALDLAPGVFAASEIEQIKGALREIAIPMAIEFLDHETGVHNYWSVVTAGLAFAGSVLNDRAVMERAAGAYELYCNAFQPDGTYAESLQYANYAALTMMLSYESLTRRDPQYAARLRPQTYAGFAKWAAYAHLYCKPMQNWGQTPIPRAINFGDSAAIFIPSADLLLHIASRCATSDPQSAKLARWLYDTAIAGIPDAPPYDRASFGFVNRPGFLSMPLLAQAIKGASPTELNLPVQHAFECGDVIARDGWDGKTVLAIRTGGEPMNVVSHVHGDINSIQLIHNNERLLVDPGHSCYRNLIHDLECSSATHNTCTFSIPGDSAEHMQRGIVNRKRIGDQYEPPIAPLSRLLLSQTDGPIRVMACDAAGRYGEPITSFMRATILCGSNLLFVVDRIRSATPVTTRWNWLLNHRDASGELDMTHADRIDFARANAGLRLFHPHLTLNRGGPQYAYVHDAYHPLPNQLGEGAIGSGLLVHLRERSPSVDRTVVCAIAVDDRARIKSWEATRTRDCVILTGCGEPAGWSLRTEQGAIHISDHANALQWRLSENADGVWALTRT